MLTEALAAPRSVPPDHFAMQRIFERAFADMRQPSDQEIAEQLVDARLAHFSNPIAVDLAAWRGAHYVLARQPRADYTIDQLPFLANVAPTDEVPIFRANGSGGGVTYKTYATVLAAAAGLQLGPFIDEFLSPADNPNDPLFDWGPVLTRAALSVGGNTTIQFRSSTYRFATPGQITGTGINLFGAGVQATILQAAGNNTIVVGPTWQNSYVQNIEFLCRQDGAHPTGGAALDLSQTSGIHVRDCQFNGTWYGIFAQGCQQIILRDNAATNFRKAGYWFAQAAGQGKIVQLRNCAANPASVAGGAALDATGYVFDGNIASITIDGFGGTGNSSDLVSIGDGMRFQNSFGGQSANLIEIRNGTFDHWPQYGYNFANWIGPSTAIDTSPGASATSIAKMTCANLVATSGNTGLYLDNLGGFQATNLDMSSNGRGYYLGANAGDVVATAWKTDIAGATGVWIAPGFKGLQWSGGQVGKLGTTATGVGFRFAQIASVSPGSNDNIFIHDCPIHATTPVGIAAPGGPGATSFASFLGNNVEFMDCDGFNPLMKIPSIGFDPSGPIPATGVATVNANPFWLAVKGNSSVDCTVTVTPVGINPMDGPVVYPFKAGNFAFEVPTWGTFMFTYTGANTGALVGAGL